MIYLNMLPIGQGLYLARMAKKMTQAELARRTQIPQANISNIEKGKRDITVSTLLRICAALEVSPPALFEEVRHSISMSRASLERIAKSVFNPRIRLPQPEREVADLLRKQLPPKTYSYLNRREVYQTWLELRSRFSDEEVRALFERVEDARKRLSAAAGALYGNVRPSLDLDFEIQLRGKKPARGKIDSAIKNASSHAGLAVNYSEDIGHWSMIEYLDYRKKAVSYKRIGKLNVKLMAPEYWTIGKMTRFLAVDIVDLVKVIKKKRLKSGALIKLWGRALRKSRLSEASGRFRDHVLYFLKHYGKRVWGRDFDPEQSILSFKRSAGTR